MIPSEHAEQVTFVNWFKSTHTNVLIFAIPNGEYRDPKTAQKLKQEGVKSGIPDLFIPEWNLWVEMKKSKGGRVSAEQKEIISYLENIGHKVIIGYGCKDAIEKLNNLLDI